MKINLLIIYSVSKATKYQLNDPLAIKLKQKFIGHYKVTKVKQNNTYDAKKCGFFDEPSCTSTCAEFLKP